MNLFRLAMVSVMLCVILTPTTSHAADLISFTEKEAFKDIRASRLLASYNFAQIAAIDLNNDSIDEYILSKNSNNLSKEYNVLALTDDGAVSLATISAQKLMLAYDQNAGVRSILGFSDADNDYEYDIYTWDAMRSSFVPAQKGGSR